MLKYNNLHCHTTNSDGKLTVPETIQFCEENRVGAVAFTDHDSVLKEEDIHFLHNYKGEVRWVSGTELAVGEIEGLDERVSLLHLVGLFVDPTNRGLLDFCSKAQEARKERMQRIVNNLKSINIDITEQDCLEASGGEAVGRPHIVESILKYEDNRRVTDNLYREMTKESLNRPELKEKIKAVERYGDIQKPYSLFLSNDAYIPDIYVDYLFRPTLDECVSVIRNAGGLSFLAHYYYSSRNLPLPFTEKLLKENRLDGIEVIYGLEVEIGEDSKERRTMREQKKELLEIASRTNCFVSGGSDAHNLEHWLVFVRNKGFAKQTIGLLDAIVEKRDDLKWYKS
jgi:predicted metal-dependent phosphoesterase TrpH